MEEEKMNDLTWEKIYGSSSDVTLRAKVEGGWLYLHKAINHGNSTTSMVFVPEKT